MACSLQTFLLKPFSFTKETMAKFKKYDYSQRILLPVSLEDQLMPGTLEFAIHTLIENRLDMSVFDENYQNDETGRSAYSPKVLLKVVLLGYSRGLISSRQLERACKENVLFIALSCDQHPDHSTIAAFVSSMKDQIILIFSDILLVCEEEKLLGGTFFAVDGCKLPSNASVEWSGKIQDLKKRKKKIERKVRALLEEQVETDKKEAAVIKDMTASREQQIEKLRKHADRIEKWLGGHDKRMGKHGREIQSNITDNESAKMKTSHGTIQGYNGQALVDSKHQVIIHGEAVGNGQDADNIPPMIDGAKKNLQRAGESKNYFEGKVLTADSNYHSTTNIEKCDEEGLDAYIPDNKFRIRDKRFSSRDRFSPKSKKFSYFEFQYDDRNDHYICPNGKKLKRLAKRSKNKGRFIRSYVSNEADCKVCQLRSKCLRYENTKQRYLSYFIDESNKSISKEMVKKVETERGRRIYPQRVAIVEPVFANIRTQKRMDRFTLRGKIKVNIQWLLYCMVHNIEKVVNYGFT
jgi:transposase